MLNEIIKKFDKEVPLRRMNDDNPQYVLGWNAARETAKPILRSSLRSLLEAVVEEITGNIDCEIGCIKGGNALSPVEQEIAISACENIKERNKGLILSHLQSEIKKIREIQEDER